MVLTVTFRRCAMTALASAQSCGEVIQHTCRGRAVRRLLLLVGIETVAVYGVGDLLSRLLYDGFSVRDQAISGGIIAPHRQLEPLPWIST
jgi:hypothetical protein